MKNAEILIQHAETKNGKTIVMDITDIVGTVKVTTYLELKPSKLDISIKPLDSIELLTEGAFISVKVQGIKLFYGRIFTIDLDHNRHANVTAYGFMRYLQNKDTLVTKKSTASMIFKGICQRCGLKYRVISESEYTLPKRIQDNKTYADIIAYALDKTLIDTGEWFFLRDNWGTIDFLNVSQERTPVYIGDESLLSSFSYKSSIDDETYNQIKLTKENKKTKKRDVYIQKDSINIKRWGLLQYYESVQESMNTAQIKKRLDMLIKYYNKPKRTLKLPKCIGDFRIMAGRSFVLGIDSLKTVVPYNQYVICSSCIHTITNDMHTMELEVYVNASR